MGNKEMSGFTLFAKEMRIKSIYIILILFEHNCKLHFDFK